MKEVMPYNPKSLKNLVRHPTTKAKKKLFSLTQTAIDWLSKQPNQTAAIERLIEEEIKREKNV